jgi:flagellar L-ring protein precursor FlgH
MEQQAENHQPRQESPSGLLWFLLLLFFVMSAVTAGATSFGQLRSASMFTDIKAQRVGDLLTVLIEESAVAQNAVKTDVKKTGKFDLNAGPGFGNLFDLIPNFGATGTSDNQSNNEGQTARSGSLKATMTVHVAGVRDNGDLVIEGTRVIGINTDKEMLILTGVVRPEDISPSNTIYSSQVADAQITYRGKGSANNGGKPGWIMRFLNWVF